MNRQPKFQFGFWERKDKPRNNKETNKQIKSPEKKNPTDAVSSWLLIDFLQILLHQPIYMEHDSLLRHCLEGDLPHLRIRDRASPSSPSPSLSLSLSSSSWNCQKMSAECRWLFLKAWRDPKSSYSFKPPINIRSEMKCLSSVVKCGSVSDKIARGEKKKKKWRALF